MLKICIIVLLWVIGCEAVSKKCMTNSDCGQNQCCNNYHGPMIASKRRDVGSLIKFVGTPGTHIPQGGYCENYLPEGSSCSSIAKMNGHCGCNIYDGLSCQFFPASTTTASIVKRGMIAPWLGTSKCAKLQVSR